MDFSKAVFGRYNLCHVYSDIDFSGKVFTSTDGGEILFLVGQEFNRCNFDKSDLSQCAFMGSRFDTCYFSGPVIAGLYMGCEFVNCYFSGIDALGVNGDLPVSRYTLADCFGVNFKEALDSRHSHFVQIRDDSDQQYYSLMHDGAGVKHFRNCTASPPKDSWFSSIPGYSAVKLVSHGTEKACINCANYRPFLRTCPHERGELAHNRLCSVGKFEPVGG